MLCLLSFPLVLSCWQQLPGRRPCDMTMLLPWPQGASSKMLAEAGACYSNNWG